MKKLSRFRLFTAIVLALLLIGSAGTAMAYTAEYTINDTGGDCSSIGIWNSPVKTCVLTTDLAASNAQDALILLSGDGIVLEGNNHEISISASFYGQKFIVLDHATNSTVRNVTLTGSGWGDTGMLLELSSFNTLQNIRFDTEMVMYGLVLNGSDSNSIIQLDMVSIGYGITLDNSRYNILDDNMVIHSFYGLQLLNGSSYNTFTNNTIQVSDYGVVMTANTNNNDFQVNSIITDVIGMYNESASGSSGNTIYNNEFLYNTPFVGPFSQNQFYGSLPLGGNYYSIYNSPAEGCEDIDSDNFCDIGYNDPSGAFDQYPYVTPTFLIDVDIDGYRDGLDCNDNNSLINPGAYEMFNNSIDENCNGMADDTDNDLDAYSAVEDCNDDDPNINPDAAEIPYNGIDENCNGMADDNDLDSDGYGIATDCNDYDPNINPGAAEIPYNGIDENCNGMQDDTDTDLDGYDYTIDCNDDDPNINPGAAEIPYNGIDENCNGMADDDDFDSDGYGIATDCNDNDPNINPGTAEIPYNGIDENCNGMADDNDFDSDGYGIATDCNDNDPNINPGAAEIPYNGIDENCNGMADDDDLDSDGYGIATDCNDDDPNIHPGVAEIKHDGIDQDCNGYDLTIDIVSTDYKSGPDRLSVVATSSYGASAALVIDGYGEPMSWNSKKSLWEGTVQPAGGNPGSVTVTGPEGSGTELVQ